MTAFSQRSEKVCLYATNPVASKDLRLGHFVGDRLFLKREKRPYHQHTC